jgi:HSP20 family protein|tara:strand:+ start:247 stop:678 length:432 start_codon:yes stop_codon:yes gene_type:complete
MTHVNLFDQGFASPLDVLVKNFFDKEAIFDKPTRTSVTHPIDVFEDENGLTFEIACVGLDKKDVKISIESDILKVSYDKGSQQKSTPEKRYYHTGVRKSSFNLGWKVARRFNLAKANAEMVNGLLCIQIPLANEAKPKTLTIK